MAHSFRIDSKNNILWETYTGKLNQIILIKANNDILECSNFKKGLKFFTDLRKAHILLNYSQMSNHVRLVPDMGIKKQVFLVNSDLNYGMTRMFEMLMENKEFKAESLISKSYEEGVKWLNL